MNRKELLIEIGQRATKSQLEEILEGLIREDDPASAPANAWTLEDQLEYSFNRMQQEFRDHEVHWDQMTGSDVHDYGITGMARRLLQKYDPKRVPSGKIEDT